jgi:hypothetical protein
MYGNEELLTDEGYRQLNGNQQYELIAAHCRGIEERIRSASSRPEAMRIADAACTQIELTCHSVLIRTALAANVEEMISRYWNTALTA